MKPSLYSYTGTNGTTNTTLNDGVNFRCFFTKLPIVPDAQANRVTRGDAQESFLAGVQTPGMDIEMTFECLQANPRDGVKILTAMFSNKDKREKTLIFQDQDDGNRQWYVTCRNKGVPEAKGPKILVCHAALKSSVALTVSTNAEAAWDTTTPTNTYTISTGNLDAIPTLEISTSSVGSGGQRYCRFVKIRNYTTQTALQYPIDVTNGGIDTTALVNFTGISVQVNSAGGINNDPATTTIPYDTPVGGAAWINLALPFMIYRNGEQMLVTARTGGPGYTSGNLTVVRAVNGSAISSHADNVVLALSKATFDGREVRVKTGDGSGALSDSPFWFGTGSNAWNQVATKIWTNRTITARALGTLAADISNSDTSLTITDAEGSIDPTNGILFFSSGTEVTPYVGYNLSTGAVTGLVRAGRDGTGTSHAAGETVYFIGDTWLYYGATSLSAPAYETNPVYLAQKPPFNLGSSGNSQWIYSTFASAQANSPYEFKDTPGTGVSFTQDASATAPFTNPPVADPVTDIGVAAIAKNASPYWRVNIPFGLTSLVATTVKRINLPANQAILKAGGTAAVISATTLANTWQTLTSLTLTPSSTANFAQLMVFNNTTANWTRWAAVSVASAQINLSTETSSSFWGIPFVSIGNEQGVDVDIDTTIGNSTTGESIQIKFPNLIVGTILRINCLAHTITYTKDNSNAYSSLRPYPARESWLRLQQGSNTLTCSQPGLSITVKEQYRNEGLA